MSDFNNNMDNYMCTAYSQITQKSEIDTQTQELTSANNLRMNNFDTC